jgi:hypothetical protein
MTKYEAKEGLTDLPTQTRRRKTAGVGRYHSGSAAQVWLWAWRSRLVKQPL